MPFYKMGNNIPVLNTSGTFLISKILLNVLVKIGAMMCLQLVKRFAYIPDSSQALLEFRLSMADLISCS
jgi:hypothetical protein